ncbi:membrane transporter [Colletotrichum tofieldiae]|nr:membrane transporter [Colletotrichum tofieldiae]GKT67570.1 membrane transporter [Colletotrichum tofieldiae]
MTSKSVTDPSHGEKGKTANDNGSVLDATSSPVYESGNDLLGDEKMNPVLLNKMYLVNKAINEIGWTPFHLKLFFLNGFGYAVDSMAAMLQGIIATQAYVEIGGGGYRTGLTMALYAGLLVGALFWGFGADIIGRRIAFNITLVIAAVSTIVAGAMPNWGALGLFVAALGFGAGGNLILDPAVFLEFLPFDKQWTITAMAAWWGLGQTLEGGIAWGIFSRDDWSCEATPEPLEVCTWQNNKAWRLIMFTSGAIILVMSVARVLVVRLEETPKYLLSAGRDADLVANLQALAARYDRTCSLTTQQLEACGHLNAEFSERKAHQGIGRQLLCHLRGLFVTRKIAISTGLIWLSWAMIGMAYPLFYVFLPSVISSRIAADPPTFYETWRDYTIVNFCAIFGPLIAGCLAEIRILGRRYTMVIGAIVTMAFFFGYTAVSTTQQNLALSCSISVCINVYYGTLYAYTAEVLPSAHRTTGNGVAVAANRAMGLLSAVIAVVADTKTATPLYICAALFFLLAVVSALLPFEPYGRRAS